MSEATVIDVRDGLTKEAIERLQRTGRLQLAFKDSMTAVLGLWASEDAPEPLTVLVLRSMPSAFIGPEDDYLFDMRGPARGGTWQHIAAALRPRDELTLSRYGGGDISVQIGLLSYPHQPGRGVRYSVKLRARRWRPSQSN